MQQLPPIIKNLLLINIGLFVLQLALKNLTILSHNYPVDLVEIFGLHYIFSPNFRPFQLLTHLFLHGSLGHLLTNMFAVFSFGPSLERALGGKRFLIFCLVTGLGAAILYSALHYFDVHRIEVLYANYLMDATPESFHHFLTHFPESVYEHYNNFIRDFSETPTNPSFIAQSKEIANILRNHKVENVAIGFSGIVFGILTAFAMLFPNERLFLLFFPVPIKAKYFVIFYGIYELYGGLKANPSDNIAHFSHLGGILFGFLLIKWWSREQKHYY